MYSITSNHHQSKHGHDVLVRLVRAHALFGTVRSCAFCSWGARWRARAMLVIAVTVIAATPINDAVV
jgi:hypothetical protein